MNTPRRKTRIYSKYRMAIAGLRDNLAQVDLRTEELSRLLQALLNDENFLTLLKAEGLVTMPSSLRSRIQGNRT